MTALWSKLSDNRYFAALVLVGAVISLPITAAFFTIGVYLSPSSLPDYLTWLGRGNAVLILGFVITLIVWLLVAVPFMQFATCKGGRPSDYETATREITLLRARYDILNDILKVPRIQSAGKFVTCQESDQDHKLSHKIVLKDIENDLCEIKKMLGRQGLMWVLGTGYVALWNRINKVDEALINLLPRDQVIEGAKHDELRLKGSKVPDSEALTELLKNAITTLSSDQICCKQPSQQRDKANKLQLRMAQGILAFLKSVLDPRSPSTVTNGQAAQQTHEEARNDIRKVRYILHKFTNERWDGLVRTRNQLMGTALLTGFFTYLLVLIAILGNVQPLKIVEALVFWLLGVIVGTFNQLINEWSKTDVVFDDYGSTMARIMVTPLLSGLGALVGVLLVSILLTTTLSHGLTNQQNVPNIATIYDITTNPQNLVFAAVFGLLPSLVISLLQGKAEEVKSQIKSSDAGDGKKGNGASSKSNGSSNSGRATLTGGDRIN